MSNEEKPLTSKEAISAAAKLAGVNEELIHAILGQESAPRFTVTPADEATTKQSLADGYSWPVNVVVEDLKNGAWDFLKDGHPPPVKISTTHEFANSTPYIPPIWAGQPLDIYGIAHRSKAMSNLAAKMKEGGEKAVELAGTIKVKRPALVYHKPSWEYFGLVGRMVVANLCRATPAVMPGNEATKKFMADWLAAEEKRDVMVDHRTDLLFERVGKMHVHKAGQKTGGKMRHKKKKLYSITGEKVIAVYRFAGCYPTKVSDAKDLPDGNVELNVTFDTESITKLGG